MKEKPTSRHSHSAHGWLAIDKPSGLTSADVVARVKKSFMLSRKFKVGHAGTLDPNAEGILPIAIGDATKLISLIQNKNKIYEFEIKWGQQTTTDDKEGTIIEVSKKIPSPKEIRDKINEFIGDFYQKPPKVSAVKINGKRAYKRFLNNENFETKERKVSIYKINLLNSDFNNVSKFCVECGKGFYVRSFARDLGLILKTRAHIVSLKRIKVGKFSTENSILLDDLLKIRQMASGIKGFLSSLSMLDDIPAFEIDTDEMYQDISVGKKVSVKYFDPLIKKDNLICFAIKQKKIISFGEIKSNYFMPKKVFIRR